MKAVIESGDKITRIITNVTRQRIVDNLPEPESIAAINILTAAGFHLRVANFGLHTYERLVIRDIDPQGALHETQQFVELGCEHMICGGLASCLDLCAATICRVSGLHPTDSKKPNHEASVASFKDKRQLKKELRSGAVEKPLADWMTSIIGDHRFDLLRKWRDPATHGWVPRTQTVAFQTIGIPSAVSDPTHPLKPADVAVNDAFHDVFELSKTLFKFTHEEYRKFVEALELALA